MERTERLLDLVALLLDANEPVPWRKVRAAFPDDYDSGSEEAAERKFERDKAELLELGIPITYVQSTDEHGDGYLVDKREYYLPEVGLAPDELAVLYAAGSAVLASGAFPARDDLAHALRKIGFYAGPGLSHPKVKLEVPQVGGSHLPERLEQLWAAIAARKRCVLSYYSPKNDETTERTLDPWGLGLRRGIWSVVGFCHLRKAPRTFHVHRIRALDVNVQKPRTPDFEVPSDFRVSHYVANWPWTHRFHEPLRTTVSLSGPLVPTAEALFGQKASPTRSGADVQLDVTFLDGLLSTVLSLHPHARITGPTAAVEAFEKRLRAVALAHRKAEAA